VRTRTLDGIEMRPVDALSEGRITCATLFSFNEADGVVSARYSGGPIVLGYLIGKRTPAGVEFSYVQADVSGGIDIGRSSCDLNVLPDGRLQLVEHFRWESREGAGVNVMEEAET
jgi:hypothetical protein